MRDTRTRSRKRLPRECAVLRPRRKAGTPHSHPSRGGKDGWPRREKISRPSANEYTLEGGTLQGEKKKRRASASSGNRGSRPFPA